MAILSFAAAFLLSLTSFAQNGEQLKLRGPWSEAIRGDHAIYGCKDGVYRPLYSQLAFEVPSPFAIIPVLIESQNEFQTTDAEQIASQCRKQYNNSFDLIACASRKVNSYYKDKQFTELASFCRSHMKAFNKTFDALRIPRSNSSMLQLEGKFHTTCEQGAHVVNRVTLVSEDGQPYSYAIDSGNFPGEAFPLTDMTVQYHKKQKSFPVFKYASPPCDQEKSPFGRLKEISDFVYTNMIAK